jgi:hypothetical protein
MRFLLAGLVGLSLFGCGGGGGGGNPPTGTTVVGRVIWVVDGQAPSPSATVQADTASTQTSTTDGSFSFVVPQSATSVLVLYQSGSTTASFRFTIPPATGGTADMGDLYIGPEKVTVKGRVISAIDSTAVQGAQVDFASRSGATDASGNFSLGEVAYSAVGGAFFDIEGRVTRLGFLPQSFRAEDFAVSGVVTVSDILLVPESGSEPPPPPYNIKGKVSPNNSAPGTIVTLLAGGVPIRRWTVGNDGTYGFWVLAGSYTMTYRNPTNNSSAPDEAVTLATQDQIVTRDVTLR